MKYFQENNMVLSYICVILVFGYIVMFASGPGSIPWFLVSEMFNQSARPTAASLAVCTNWTANFLVGLAFLPLMVRILNEIICDKFNFFKGCHWILRLYHFCRFEFVVLLVHL